MTIIQQMIQYSQFLWMKLHRNLAASTGKTEKPTEQLLHGANKVQPRKETLSKCKVHTRKSDGNDSSYSSYAVNDSNFFS